MTVELDNNKSSDHCDFVRDDHGDSRDLLISVAPVNRAPATPHCSSPPTPLKAIGNEATACPIEMKPGEVAEQVTGRVRDQIFVVQIITTDLNSRALIREKVRRVAEQVAGILF